MDGSHEDHTRPTGPEAPSGPGADPVVDRDVDPAQEDRPAPPPLAAFAERHRFVLGLTLGVVFAIGTVAALLYLRPDTALPGFFGIVQRFAFPTMTALIAAVGFTWGWRLPRRWPNLAAYLAIGTYLLYLVTGWVYEQFVA